MLALLIVTVPAARAKEIGPDADWCRAIQAVPAGGELILEPGDYHGACVIARGGLPGAPLTVRAKDPARPPRILYTGTNRNVIELRADHVTIRGLSFGPTQDPVDAIRIYRGRDITIEDCRFLEIGGSAIAATHASVQGLTIRRNAIVRSRSTAMYLGCHDGVSCTVSDLLIEQNFIDGVDAVQGVGYGIQVKLNSTATLRDNVVVNTKGPGIMIYGATDLLRTSLVERNFVTGSRTSSAIVLGGGPAVVRNNIALASAEAGIGLEDYGRRGLLRSIVVAHNTVYDSAGGGIGVPASPRLDVRIVNNAAHARAGARALPPAQPGVAASGNVDCTWVPCFTNPRGLNFTPLAMSAPAVRARTVMERWMPEDDYFGRPRGVPPAVGAIEPPGGPLETGMKSLGGSGSGVETPRFQHPGADGNKRRIQ